MYDLLINSCSSGINEMVATLRICLASQVASIRVLLR